MSKLTGAEIVIECLKEQGVDTVFGYNNHDYSQYNSWRFPVPLHYF